MCSEKKRELESIETSVMRWLNDTEVLDEIKTFEAAPDKLKEYLEKADSGDAEAMYQIAQIYYSGLMVPKDERKGVSWFLKKAAEQGHVGAMLDLGERYLEEVEFGRNSKRADYLQKAMTEYENAANMGSVAAMNTLGNLYTEYKGRLARRWYDNALGGVEQARAKGIQWYKKAAGQGDAVSMLSLAWLYRTSTEAAIQDCNQAFEWYLKAAVTDQKIPAMLNLGEMYERGEGTQRDMAKAIECYTVAAESEPHAMAALARIYQAGDGVPKDSAKAVEWLGKAAAADHYYAIVDLALMYAHGDGVPQDIEKASGLLASARENRRNIFAAGLYDIGRSYFEHDDTKRERYGAKKYRLFQENLANAEKKGLRFLYRAAVLGDTSAMFYLGAIYGKAKRIESWRDACKKTCAIPRDFQKALYWYQLSVAYSGLKTGDSWSMYEIGNIYYTGGDGVKQDFEKAFVWYQRAAANGERDARLKLAEMYEKGEGVKQDKKKAGELRELA